MQLTIVLSYCRAIAKREDISFIKHFVARTVSCVRCLVKRENNCDIQGSNK